MKKIEIQVYKKKQPESIYTNRKITHTVHLGNKTIFVYFTNERKLQKFIVETNRFLNFQAQHLIEIHAQLHKLVMLSWLQNDWHNHLLDNLMSTRKNWELLYSEGLENAWYFRHIITISNNYLTVAENVRETFAKKEFFGLRNEADLLIFKLCEIIEKADNWGQ